MGTWAERPYNTLPAFSGTAAGGFHVPSLSFDFKNVSSQSAPCGLRRVCFPLPYPQGWEHASQPCIEGYLAAAFALHLHHSRRCSWPTTRRERISFDLPTMQLAAWVDASDEIMPSFFPGLVYVQCTSFHYSTIGCKHILSGFE